jgi:hypothetical protein
VQAAVLQKTFSHRYGFPRVVAYFASCATIFIHIPQKKNHDITRKVL